MVIFLVFDSSNLPHVTQRLTEIINASNSKKHSFEFNDPDKADVFLFLSHGLEESGILSIKDHVLIKKHPSKCFFWCDDDHPLAILPGLYASLPSVFFNTNFHRTIFYLSRSNNLIGKLKEEYKKKPPLYLASFQGGISSNLRKKLLGLKFKTDRIFTRAVQQLWATFLFGAGFDDQESVVNEYARLIFESKFVICPKGNGVSSYRVFETLEAGRVPVIISDKFVPPIVQQASEYMLFLKEADINKLEDFLIAREPEFGQLALNAATVFDKNFADHSKLHYIGEMLEEIKQHSTIKTYSDLKKYQRKILLFKKVQFLTFKVKIALSNLLKGITGR